MTRVPHRLRRSAVGRLLLPSLALAALLGAPGDLRAAPAAVAAPEATLTMREAALLVSGQEGGSLPLALLVLSGAALETTAASLDAADGSRHPLVAQLEIDLRPADGDTVAEGTVLEVFVYALADDLRVVDSVTLHVPLPVTASDPALRVLAPMAVEAGEVEVRALARLRSTSGERFGLRRSALTVPSAAPPLVAASDRWRVVYPAARPPRLAAPWSVDGSLPSSLPVVPAGGSVRLRTSAPHDRWVLERTDSETAPVEVAIDAAGDDRARLLELPLALEPGLWRLRSTDGAPGLALAVVDADPQASPPDWRSLARRRDVDRPIVPPPVVPELELRRREQRALMLEVYRETRALYERLGRDGLRAAVAELEAREAELVERHGADALEPMAVGQRAAFRELARAAGAANRPDAMLPAIFLTASTARAHLRARRSLLARMGLEQAATLVDAWVDDAGASPAAAGRILAVLSLRPLRHGALAIASSLLGRAIALAPDDDAALLALGSVHTRGQQLDEAARVLEQLAAVDSSHAEARLRLGIVERRRGDAGAARRHFESVRGEASWIGALATQELVRLDLTTGRLEDAAAGARAGLERRPDDQALRVALAWTLEALGDEDGAREAVAALDPGARASSRDALVALPLGGLGARRRELLAAAEAQRAVLLDLSSTLPASETPPRWALSSARSPSW